MRETITLKKVKKWAKNHESNLDVLPFRSCSAAISLGELESFISAARAAHTSNFNALKVYFVRYEFKSGKVDSRIEKAKTDTNLSQVSLLFVPAQITDSKNWIVKILKDPADPSKVLALRVCDPDSPADRDETGMCPPKCEPNESDPDD